MSAADSTSRKQAGAVRKTADFILGMFTRNLVSKVAALALALLVWITVRQDLTREEKIEARVVPDLAANLMLLETPPRTVTIVIEGPTSEVDQLRRTPEKVEIVLSVGAKDLGDDLLDTRTFSVEQGNIEHSYGEHVRITQIVEGTITLKVAVRGEERKPVGRPAVVGLPKEWEARLELVDPDVRLTGPKAMLDRITEVQTNPIQANRLLEGVEVDQYTTTVPLELTDQAIADRITLVPGDRMECRVTLTRSLAEQPFVVPFTVFVEKADWPVVIKVHETRIVKRNEAEDGSYTISLTLRGSPTDLTRVEEALEAGRVRAYVRAMELVSYAEKSEGRENANVHLELPTELWGRVGFRPPPREDIDLEVLKRAEESE